MRSINQEKLNDGGTEESYREGDPRPLSSQSLDFTDNCAGGNPLMVVDIIFSLVQLALSDWEEADVRYYFELAYRDSDMSLYVKTDSGIAARTIAEGVAKMLVERMKLLREREMRKELDGGPKGYLE